MSELGLSGAAGGGAAGAMLLGAGAGLRTARGADFFAATDFFAGAFLRAAFLAGFFATFARRLDFFAGRALARAALLFAAERFAFALGRVFPFAFFFAMFSSLLALVTTLAESSPEKVRCHLRMRLESVPWIAYARACAAKR